MTVRVYRSSDASAPTLTGQVGSLTALLDAVLVNGYGTQAAAGWSIAYTTTNKRAYQQNTTGSNNPSGLLLYVDDTGIISGSGAREASVCGFETMSAITPVGTGQFPSTAQATSGLLYVRKSNTADATARNWTAVANGQTLYLFVESGDYTVPLGALCFIFGDFKSYKTSDQYAVFIMARQTANVGGPGANTQFDPLQLLGGQNAISLNNRMFGHYVCRSWTALGGSVQCMKTTDYIRVGGVSGGWISDTSTTVGTGETWTSGRNNTGAQLMTPNGPDGSLHVAPIYIGHSYSLRGYLPGLWALLQDRPLLHNDSLTIASGALNGKTLLCQQFPACISNNQSSDYGEILVETSDTWT
jgi:hypothetical protein